MSTARLTSGNSRRILATIGVVGAIGALGAAGTYSLWTDSESVGPQSVAAGTVNLAQAGGTFNVAATGVAPGDTVDRIVDISNAGSIDFAGVSLSVTNSGTALVTDAQGLRMQMDACSVPWTPAGAAYTCSGTTTAVVADRAVNGTTGVAMSGLASLTAGGTDRVRVRLTLPTAAPNGLQGLTESLTYTMTATQRAGMAK